MSQPVTRIISDIHFGDRATTVASLDALLPLCEGIQTLVLNGDTLDTRPSKDPARTEALRQEILSFVSRLPIPVHVITGNHDPDIGNTHLMDLANGSIFLTHGDVVFKDLVPWGRDVHLVRLRLAEEFSALSPAQQADINHRLGAYRRAAAKIPQRHQAERDGLKYAIGYLGDTIWPPSRLLRILSTWRETPELAALLVHKHRPQARFFIMGHTHRAGAWHTKRGPVIINTGSFCHPFGACLIDVSEGSIELRRILRRGISFVPGKSLAKFKL